MAFTGWQSRLFFLPILSLHKNGTGRGLFGRWRECFATQSFDCYCGSPACLGQIQGAAFLSHDAINHYRFTDFIRRELSAKAAKTKVA